LPASLNYYINPKHYFLNLNYYLIPTPSVHAPQRAESDAPPLSLEEEVSQVTTPNAQATTPNTDLGDDGGGSWGREGFESKGGDEALRTGPSRAGDVIGDETRFVGMNKAIENRVCINLRRMIWAEPPRTVFLVEKSDGWRTSLSEGSDSRRLEHGCVLVLERICRYCKEHLVCVDPKP
jgi:hypothetical protein